VQQKQKMWRLVEIELSLFVEGEVPRFPRRIGCKEQVFEFGLGREWRIWKVSQLFLVCVYPEFGKMRGKTGEIMDPFDTASFCRRRQELHIPGREFAPRALEGR